MDEELRPALVELKRRLAVLLGRARPEILLYGSRARGDYHRDSDVDLAVIVPGLTASMKDRVLETVAQVEFEHDRPLSVLVFSAEAFDELWARERRIALDIRREGVPV